MRSIRRALLRNLLLLIAVAWLGEAAATYLVARHETQELFDAQLAQASGVIAELALYRPRESRDTNVSLSKDIYGHPYERKISFQVWRGDELVLRSRNAPGYRMAAGSGFSDEKLDGQAWRVFARRSDDGHHMLYAGERYDIRNELVGNIAAATLYPVLLLLPLAAVAVWFLIGAGLRPLARIAGEIRQRSPRVLDPLAITEVPREIFPLTQSINDLLRRLRAAFERESRFTADAAHELRTPLASIRTQAQVALRSRDAEERSRALAKVVEGTDRSARLIDQMVTLARLEPETFEESFGLVDPADVVEEVISALPSERDGKRNRFEVEDRRTDTGAMRIRGSFPALEILFRNIVENAVRHSPAAGCIRITISCVEQGVRVAVVDEGPGVPPEERDRVFERFYRSKQTGFGSGLGLSIAQRIAELHNAVIALGDNPHGQGLTVAVTFPRQPSLRG